MSAEFSAQVDLKQPWFWAGFSTLSWVVLLLGCVVYTHVKHSSQPSSLLVKVCCKKVCFWRGLFRRQGHIHGDVLLSSQNIGSLSIMPSKPVSGRFIGTGINSLRLLYCLDL